MPSLVEWVNTKWQIDRNRYSLKLRMNRATYRNFFVDEFNSITDEGEMRCIQITCCKPCTFYIKYIVVDLFYCFTINVHLTLLGIRTFCDAFPAFEIKAD